MNLHQAGPQRALAVVTHELRQPLQVMQVQAALLAQLPDSEPVARIRRIGEALQRAIDSQKKIIDDLLDFSRVRTGKLTLHRSEVDVAALVINLVATLSASWNVGTLRMEVTPSEPLICLADPVRLCQVIGNLLDNAIKFCGQGGRVVVRIGAEGGFARISVVDNGCGIEPRFLPHVFGLFSQPQSPAPGQHSGLGIGLALVHGLTVAHGGFVKATSEGPGSGAEFSVWLPLLGNAINGAGVFE